jgi:hypothetical protein
MTINTEARIKRFQGIGPIPEGSAYVDPATLREAFDEYVPTQGLGAGLIAKRRRQPPDEWYGQMLLDPYWTGRNARFAIESLMLRLPVKADGTPEETKLSAKYEGLEPVLVEAEGESYRLVEFELVLKSVDTSERRVEAIAIFQGDTNRETVKAGWIWVQPPT